MCAKMLLIILFNQVQTVTTTSDEASFSLGIISLINQLSPFCED